MKERIIDIIDYKRIKKTNIRIIYLIVNIIIVKLYKSLIYLRI